MKKSIFLLALILVGLRTPSYVQDFMDSDEAIYGTVALTITDGGEPYRDAIERKTPAVYYWYAAIFKLFGDGNMLAIHIAITLWIAFAAFLLAMLASLLACEHEDKRDYALAAVATYIVASTFYKFELLAANCEMIMDPFTIGAWITLLLFVKEGKFRYIAFSGVLFGCAFVCKQTAVFPAAAAGIWLWLNDGFKSFWEKIARRVFASVLMVAGFAVPIALSYYFFYQRGVHDDYFLWAWTANFDYMTYQFPLSHVAKKFLIATSLFFAAIAPFTYLIVRGLRQNGFDARSSMLLLWFLVVLFGLSSSGKFFSNYYFHLFAPLSLLAAAGWLKVGAAGRKRVTLSAAVMALLFCTAWFFRDALHEKFDYAAPDYRKIGERVHELTKEGDRIFVWGYSPEIYVISRRRPSARFVFCDYLSGRISGHPRVKDPNFDTIQFAAPRRLGSA